MRNQIDSLTAKKILKSIKSEIPLTNIPATSRIANLDFNINKKLNVVVLDIQPITPAIGGGRLRLLGLYKSFDAQEFDVTYVGSYDWPGEERKKLCLNSNFTEIVIPLSEEHFKTYQNFKRNVGDECFDVSFSQICNCGEDFIQKCIELAAKADIVIFSHPWLYPILHKLIKLDNKFVVYDSHNHEGKLRYNLYGDTTESRENICLNVIDAEYQLCRVSDLILCCSSEDKSSFIRYYGIQNSKLIIAPNGVFTNILTPVDSGLKKEIQKSLLFKRTTCGFIEAKC